MYIPLTAATLRMASYQQFGMHGLPYGERRSGYEFARTLLAAAFVLSICLIAIVIGAASSQ